MDKKRKIDILVLSDIHLGTYGCHARQLLCYLKSIQPGTVILNGDIIDMWQFRKNYWPKSHMKIIRHILHWTTSGVKVYYITGNHDETLRKFSGFKMGSLQVEDKLVLTLGDNKKAWFFHGDVFDVTMQHSKWLAKLGAAGYDLLILINRLANFISQHLFRKGKLSLSKRIKDNVKSAVKYINNFEHTVADIGIHKEYDYVVCGHIHQPGIKHIRTAAGTIQYLNSGDWIENLTALEYNEGAWRIYRYDESEMEPAAGSEGPEEDILPNHKLFENILHEFNLTAR